MRIFSRKKNVVSLHFEDRGETLVYEDSGSTLHCCGTWHNGFRIFTDSITNWIDSSRRLDSEERIMIAKNILLKLKTMAVSSLLLLMKEMKMHKLLKT